MIQRTAALLSIISFVLISVCATAEEPLPSTSRIMGKSVEGWIEHLKKYENEEERRVALVCLSDFGPAAAAAVPELLVLSKDELQPNTQRLAAETLGAI